MEMMIGLGWAGYKYQMIRVTIKRYLSRGHIVLRPYFRLADGIARWGSLVELPAPCPTTIISYKPTLFSLRFHK